MSWQSVLVGRFSTSMELSRHHSMYVIIWRSSMLVSGVVHETCCLWQLSAAIKRCRMKKYWPILQVSLHSVEAENNLFLADSTYSLSKKIKQNFKKSVIVCLLLLWKVKRPWLAGLGFTYCTFWCICLHKHFSLFFLGKHVCLDHVQS